MLDAVESRDQASENGACDGTGRYRLDRAGRFEEVDSVAARLLGLSRAELLGRCIWEVFPVLRDSELRVRCDAVIGGSGPQQFLFHHAPLDRWYAVVADPIGPPERPASLDLRFTDVTEAPGGIAARIRAERLAAAAQVAGRLSHDINNCLTVIMGNAEYLDEVLAGRAELAEVARLIGKAGERAAALTGRVLQFTRRAGAHATGTDVRAVLNRLATQLRESAPGIRVEVSSECGSTLVLADAGELETAILELASNGLDAMPQGGTLCLSATTEPDGERVWITVTDTGTGMDASVLQRCVEPFVSTKPEHWGVGMGLSAVYGFAAAYGGSLHLRSQRDRGTWAMLDLPGVARRARAESKGTDGARILLVEDDETGRISITRLLRTLGLDVTPVASAAEALDSLRAGQAPSLLLADVVLPGGLDGARLVAEARRLRPGLPVLLMSGYAAQSSGETLQPDGVRLLPKPFRKADLEKALYAELEAGWRAARVLP